MYIKYVFFFFVHKTEKRENETRSLSSRLENESTDEIIIVCECVFAPKKGVLWFNDLIVAHVANRFFSPGDQKKSYFVFDFSSDFLIFCSTPVCCTVLQFLSYFDPVDILCKEKTARLLDPSRIINQHSSSWR